MVRSAVRDLSAPLLVINLIFYIIVVGYASWNLNHFINGEVASPGVGTNQATIYFLIFAILAGVVGAAATVPGLYHNCLWRTDTLPAAASSAFIAWGITALAFGSLPFFSIFFAGMQGNTYRRGKRLEVAGAGGVHPYISCNTAALCIAITHWHV